MNDPPSAGPPLAVCVYADSALMSGAEVVLLDTLSALASLEDVSVTAMVAPVNERLVAGVRATGAAVVPVPVHRPEAGPLDLVNPARGRAVRTRIARQPHDLLLVNLPSPEYGSTPLLWGAGNGAPRVGLLHIHHSLGRAGFKLGALRDRLVRNALGALDETWTISPGGPADVARDWGTPGRTVRTLPLLERPVALPDGKKARETLLLPADRPVVGLIGRITIKQKGHDLFAAAAARIADSRPDVHFAVVGDGPDRSRVEDLFAAAGLADRVTFTGALHPPHAAFAALDAIALPSRFEGLPLTALEAMTAGVPGVAASVDGLAHVWPTAWTVPPDDADALGAQLLAMLDAQPAARAAAVAEGRRNLSALTTDDLRPFLRDALRRLSLARARG